MLSAKAAAAATSCPAGQPTSTSISISTSAAVAAPLNLPRSCPGGKKDLVLSPNHFSPHSSHSHSRHFILSFALHTLSTLSAFYCTLAALSLTHSCTFTALRTAAATATGAAADLRAPPGVTKKQCTVELMWKARKLTLFRYL
eukprot:1141613-Pelagomonas_calceolata.AAC.1